MRAPASHSFSPYPSPAHRAPAGCYGKRGLSLLSYHLCSYLETRSVPRVEAVQTSHLVHTSCGGWIPWRWCPKTVYRTQYLTVEVPESRNVTDCCKDYEQLGFYCVLYAGAAPERSSVSWYNVTMLVKVDFEDLQHVDPGLQNHTRLLCSLVTSALQPLDPAVHYLSSARQDPSTTLSWLLLGLPRLLPVAKVSSMLNDIVKRVYEVVSIQVQDVDECSHDGLHACSGEELCVNREGSYQCVCPQDSSAPAPQKLNGTGKGNPRSSRRISHRGHSCTVCTGSGTPDRLEDDRSLPPRLYSDRDSTRGPDERYRQEGHFLLGSPIHGGRTGTSGCMAGGCP
ncbi:Hypothetical predicted protein [Marmota monax]|uniref:EGF-like domain-containing protein n=1 Tax=Marmota monax TaxID=9995 RepID=A0A5E4BQS6_MARMO|nr:Hypothetical predicted protein [Marmota monax]